MERQQTVADSAVFSGIALHTGARATVRVVPAPENTGIVFRRVDLPGKPEVRALASHVIDVRRGTTIAAGEARVYTVEHIMSALHAFKIDNCVVEMDGMEPPIGDGSALSYCNMLREAGIKVQDAPAHIFTPDAPLYVEGGHTRMVILPGEELRISCMTSFPGCPIDPQFYEYTMQSPESYEEEVAGGRTFVDFRDLQQLIAMGLVKGGSLDAAAIIHDGAIICKEELRYPDEIVRHKILDIIGDVYLSGCRVTGTILAIKPGHPKNVELAGLMQQAIAARG